MKLRGSGGRCGGPGIIQPITLILHILNLRLRDDRHLSQDHIMLVSGSSRLEARSLTVFYCRMSSLFFTSDYTVLKCFLKRNTLNAKHLRALIFSLSSSSHITFKDI